MEDITQEKSKKEKRKLKKEDIIGFIFGISIASAIGFGGFIPYIIGIIFGIWFTNKMLNGEKRFVKVIFWVLFVVVFLLGSLFRGMRLNSNYLYLNEKDSSSVETDKRLEFQE